MYHLNLYHHLLVTMKNMIYGIKKVICDKLKCVSKIYNLEDESYYFFIIQIKNGIKSMIDNVVEVSNEKPYKPIEYELEDYTTNFSSIKIQNVINFHMRNVQMN